ncbi:MAG: FMN-binding protein [Kiritimatiellia bacterium]|nr:FMN-binding protein [Kiritimatiellia bacterium]MDP6847997.1 FMN-binding protein [Kiritimatiellia bacterium]
MIRRLTARWVVVLSFALSISLQASAQTAAGGAHPSLAHAIRELKVPPSWWNDVETRYDLNKPWKDARLEIRRRLARGDQANLREAMKLTVLYAQKKDIGDGHELPMYLFMGGEFAWAIQEYRKFLTPTINDPDKRGETHGFICLAASYQHFGEYDKSVKVCNIALKHLPEPPWTEMNAAKAYSKLGDLSAEQGKKAAAREYYEKAITNYKVAKPKYGRHLLPRRIAQVQSRLDLLVMASLRSKHLRDGEHRAQALGYSEPLTVIVTVRNGRIVNVQVKHKEKIELGATQSIPKQIVDRQDLRIDAVTGATVTSQAIVEGALNALKKAGL